ncbi:ribosomal-like protein [Scheffersomyces spartinae]|uniref:Ribosome biogenesis protein RLP7 n=1 Tax=Scheffersomyces spartinae TaxID=45513 RepID=A0A9P8AIT1_9ASCO|nr:ribosomal-like protein [Scheffersomyces spartinae]KAG7194010.1 ribosomal-like protein [Scheffersomyces spartinae]
MAVLNTNPEILLKKRKDKDRKRLEKQEQAIERELKQKIQKKKQRSKFIRAETLISNHKSKELESKRIKNITKHEQRISHDDTTTTTAQLLFVIRVPDHTKGLKIPSKAKKVLDLLKLNKPNTGVFVKLTSTVEPLLKLVNPYIVCGTPSLQTVRTLFQKRATIKTVDEETGATKTVKLDNNQVVEDVFGTEYGWICIEDLVHELVSLGDNFKVVSHWLVPFSLNLPVSGWGPQAKLARLQLASANERKVSLAGNVLLAQIDIDKIIEDQN